MIDLTTVVVVIVLLYLLSSIKILREYERGVIFRLGRVLSAAKGSGRDPGIRAHRPDRARIAAHRHAGGAGAGCGHAGQRDGKGERGDLFSRDRSAPGGRGSHQFPVCHFAAGADHAAQRARRSGAGRAASQREKLNVRLQSILDQHTAPWGVKVTMVEVKQVDLAEQMIRAIARQAEAERERRAKIINAEGEYTAAEKLSMAAAVIQTQPAALQLRYLQTLVEIGTEKNTTIVFPLPLDILSSLGRALDRVGNPPEAGRGKSSRMRNNETGEFELVVGNRQLLSGVFHCGPVVRGGICDGVRSGTELAPVRQTAGGSSRLAPASQRQTRGRNRLLRRRRPGCRAPKSPRAAGIARTVTSNRTTQAHHRPGARRAQPTRRGGGCRLHRRSKRRPGSYWQVMAVPQRGRGSGGANTEGQRLPRVT